jgi:hypothetical protein
MQRAYELICKESLDSRPGGLNCRRSSLNGEGAPIQFALMLGEHAPPLQFLSEIGDSAPEPSDALEFTVSKLRSLAALLQLKGDIDSLIGLLERTSAVNVYDLAPAGSREFWLGTGLTREGHCGLKLYLSGKAGTEAEQWTRIGEFAAYFGVAPLRDELWKALGRSMLPLGMGITLSQSKLPAGRIYLRGYGNRLEYYEDLLRNFGSVRHGEAFRHYTEIMLEDDRSYPTSSVVFSAGFEAGKYAAPDIKLEFCAHCLFQSDCQARERCLRWLALRRIESREYEAMLRLLAGQMSEVKTNAHVYVGLGWKGQREYSSIYLKPTWRSPSLER